KGCGGLGFPAETRTHKPCLQVMRFTSPSTRARAVDEVGRRLVHRDIETGPRTLSGERIRVVEVLDDLVRAAIVQLARHHLRPPARQDMVGGRARRLAAAIDEEGLTAWPER